MSFSTIKPRVFHRAIFMPDLNPSKLTIPVAQDVAYDFTCEDGASVADFRETVLANTDGHVKRFELLAHREGSKKAELVDGATSMADLKAGRFEMHIDSKRYQVYPDFLSIARQP